MHQFLALILILSGSSAFAKGGDDERQLSVSGGIASPSFSSAVFQNPAGLTYNSKLRGTIQAKLNDPFTLHGGILAGNGDFGAAAGLSHAFKKNDDSTSAFYGLGVGASKFALGVAGFTNLSTSDSHFNAGLMIGPTEPMTLGITAIGIDDGVNEWGLGFAYRFQGLSGFILDTTIDEDFDHVSFQPGIIVGNPKAALTISYGFSTEDHLHSHQLSDGLAVGGSLQLGSSVSWQLYYNQLAKYYTAVAIAI